MSNYKKLFLQNKILRFLLIRNLKMANCPKFRPVTHVIFDLDGTILDTEPIYEEVLKEILAVFGKTLTEELRFKVLGSTTMRLANFLVNDQNLDISAEDFKILFDNIAKEKLKRVKLLPGALRLICHLSVHKIPMALATSSDAPMAKLKITPHTRLFNLLHHHVYGGSDPEVKESKPAPDIFLTAANRFDEKPDPSQCLVIEDAPNGVAGAVAAGMQVVMVPDKQVPAALRSKATLVLSSLCDFRPEKFGLPAFIC